MLDIILFRKMISPLILQLLFWPAVMASIYYSIKLIATGHDIGWVPLIVGSLFVRVVFEGMLLLFRIYEQLIAIRIGLEITKEARKTS